SSVDEFLPRTHLGVFDAGCQPEITPWPDPIVAADLPHFKYESDCTRTGTFTSGGSRSADKQHTFFLSDVADSSANSASALWTTYVHVYGKVGGGLTFQYGRFKKYNTGKPAKVGGTAVKLGFHGGDWEGVHVILNANSVPIRVRYLGH